MQAMANAAARALIQRHLRFSHYLILRFAVPLVAYVPMSLTYTLVSLAFHLPFDTRYATAIGLSCVTSHFTCSMGQV